ncbi:MAG TPA: sulfite exporter TauE/SafE family protein [Bacteroidia bacterium]|nr:sulfite exporter TauE/SafE family protein [Bacteroidia bacterium]
MEILLLLSLAFIAFCYSAVGHGGASGYIAVFALFGLISNDMKSFVLFMNLGVAMFSFYHYFKQGFFSWKYFLPFGLGAAPMAYFGASLEIDTSKYQFLLALFLFFSVIYLLGIFKHFEERFKIQYTFLKALLIAILLGFIAGITGVGGGIFLSPILLIFGWQNVKQTAGISALFIAVNSFAGLIAMNNFSLFFNYAFALKLLATLTFGYLGSQWGCKLENTDFLKKLLAFVLIIAGLKLLLI